MTIGSRIKVEVVVIRWKSFTSTRNLEKL